MKRGRLECTEKTDISVLAFIVIVDAIPVRRHALDWILTRKASCKICSRQHFEFFIYDSFIFQGKYVLTVHVNHQLGMSRLFSEKIKAKLFSTAVAIGALRVKRIYTFYTLGLFFFSAAHQYIS